MLIQAKLLRQVVQTHSEDTEHLSHSVLHIAKW